LLSAKQMEELDAGRRVPVGWFGVYSLLGVPSVGERDLVTRMDHSDAGIDGFDSRAVWMQVQPSSFEVDSCTVTGPGGLGLWRDGGGGMSVGESIRLRGPDKTVTLLHTGLTSYSAELARTEPVPAADEAPGSAWTPGAWTIEADGSDEVPPFGLGVALHPARRILNRRELLSIDRSKELLVRWNGSEMAADELVHVSLVGAQAGVRCTAAATAGELRVPTAMLQPVGTGWLAASVARPQDRPRVLEIPTRTGETVRAVFVQSSGEFFGVSTR
jgi:hypothetical protein